MSEQLMLTGIVRPVVVAVGGCSGSGKTMLARELAQQLQATLFPLDFYYRDLAHLSIEQRNNYNFDHPDSLEHNLIVEHVQALRDGKAIDRPNYDFTTHSRVKGLIDHVSADRFVIVEGILALHYRELTPLCDLSVYVETPHDVCLMRRIHRDVRERGRTEESVRTQFETFARPMADEYVLPGRDRADIVVSGTEALDWSVEQVLSTLRERELLHSDSLHGNHA